MFDLDPDSMGAYFLEESIMAGFDEYSEDEYSEAMYSGHNAPQSITCRHCNNSGFYWQELPDGKWRLFDEYGMHYCLKKKESNNVK